jgi:hypothetical protein
MARTKFSSPTLVLKITPEQHERAVKSDSGGCLIADAIKDQYPQLTGITVDMATIRVSDRQAGMRYTYLTPPIAQHLLLAFDQGWPQPADELVVKRAVKITPIMRPKGGPRSRVAVAARREARIAELEAKLAAGEQLDAGETRALGRMRHAKPAPDRPSTRGAPDIKIDSTRGAIVYGGNPVPQGKPHPNLLRGRDRHFGAKLADPGEAFREAVDAAVAERLAENGRKGE